ncbi:nickel-binding protein [Aestuariibaculum sediminum]|uniref:DUF4242 domain-containing protein n=1 Tax=Aestuariibaculum sediminum TaxID=2770637 RepID=A0A8J6Q9B3_9FLAO|nr:nickel-binding protein [Aestuariibaculum sediminum]MBD0830751.1 DUF4242 domain-containing protein [Aestuariibaculum sediminum]
MPIFMDRHDVSEHVSAEVLAEIHQEDLKIEHEYGCRGFTYWFDNKRKNVFCLIEAPNKEAIVKMHRQAHGDVPNTIIEVEASLVESFLGRISDPENTNNSSLNIINDSAYRILMYISFYRNPSSNGYGFQETLKTLDHHITKLINTKHGNIVKKDKHGYLISFKSVINAINTVVEIESKIRNNLPMSNTYLKIAVASGEPVTSKPQIFEDVITLINRMCESINSDITISYEVKQLYESETLEPLPLNKTIRALTPVEEKFLMLFMDNIENSWHNPEVSIEALSESLGYSKSQLYRKVTALTGKSPNSFLRDYRLERAVRLMDNQEGNISEIAFETGFNSLAYFSKCFKNKYNMLPSKYTQ